MYLYEVSVKTEFDQYSENLFAKNIGVVIKHYENKSIVSLKIKRSGIHV